MNNNPKKVWKKDSLLKQLVIIIAVVLCALVIVFAIDILTHPGRSWNESMVINMIMTKRSGH